jgi:hypothetical protein
MKKLFAVGVFSVLCAASTAFVLHLPGHDPVRGLEGPDVRLSSDDRQSDQPIKGTEGPDIS